MTFEGGCHCGNIRYAFETERDLATLGVRACLCSFCRAHGARNVSDPDGAMRISVRDGMRLERYRFGLRTADFLICTTCGVYVGALLPGEAGGWFTANVNSFDDKPVLDFPLAPHDYGDEDAAGRVARREMRWTPVKEILIG
jgi:hypothetical protein